MTTSLSAPPPGASPRRVIAVMWLAAALLALGVSPHWRVNPDSALYTGMARAIATGRGYTFSGEVQFSIPPAVPLYLALVYKAAHAVDPALKFLDTFIFWNSCIALAAMAGLVAAYFLARRKAPSDAFLVLLLLATSSRFVSAGITPLTDVPYAAASWAALLFLARSQSSGRAADRVLAAAFLTLSVLTRTVGVTLVAAAGLVYVWQLLRARSSRLDAALRITIVIPAAIASVALFAAVFFGAKSSTFNYVSDVTTGRAPLDVLAAMVSNLAGIPAYLFEGVFALESVFGLGLLFTVVSALGAFSFWRRGERLLVVYPVIYLLFVAAAYPVVPRYFVPLLPLLYLFLLEGLRSILFAVNSAFAKRDKGRVAGTLVAVLLVFTVAVNLVYVGKEVALNFSRDFYAEYRHGKYLDYFPLAAALVESPPEGRALALESRVVSALAGVDADPVASTYLSVVRPSSSGVEDYVRRRDIRVIVVDPADPDSARLLQGYVSSSPSWRGSPLGRLTLYRRDETPPAPVP